ncbi:MAG: hypothetical protein KGL39_49075 [Patescibacteria group bacterium]|nr:hypothetical protein [Patescibacteria group bacterium]
MKLVTVMLLCSLLALLPGCLWLGADYKAREDEKLGQQMLATNQAGLGTNLPPLPPAPAPMLSRPLRSVPLSVHPAITSLHFTWIAGGGRATGLQYRTNFIDARDILCIQAATNGAACEWTETNLTAPWCFYRAFDL